MQVTTGTDAIQTKSHFTYAVRPDRSRRPLKLVCGRTQTIGITPFYGLRDLFDPLIKMLQEEIQYLLEQRLVSAHSQNGILSIKNSYWHFVLIDDFHALFSCLLPHSIFPPFQLPFDGGQQQSLSGSPC